MGCCTSQPKPKPPQNQPEAKPAVNQPQVQPTSPPPPQKPKEPEWFVVHDQRNRAEDIKDFRIIGDSHKSSKYNSKVKVFEVQKLENVKIEDIKLEFVAGKDSSSTVGAAKIIVLDGKSGQNEENAKLIYERLKNVKENIKNMNDVVDFDFRITKNKDVFYIDIFMPYASHGTLEDEINKRFNNNKQYFKSEQIIKFMTKSLDTFKALQNKGIKHTDIKPQNFLLLNSYDISEAKISDFRVVQDFISAFPTQPSEHIEYTAPKLREEGAKQKTQNTQEGHVEHQPYKSDLFSLGLTWLKVVTLTDVRGINTQQDIEKQLEYLKTISQINSLDKRISEMITKALQYDESKRPDFNSFENPSLAKDVKLESNPTLRCLIKDQNSIKDRLQPQQIQKQEVIQPNAQMNLINQGGNQGLVFYPVGDEEEHNEADQHENQSNLDMVLQLQAIQTGGELGQTEKRQAISNKNIQNAPNEKKEPPKVQETQPAVNATTKK